MIENSIRDFLRLSGVHSVWINGAMRHIERGLTTNRYFTTDVNNIKLVKLGKDGIKSLRLNVNVEFPDQGVSKSGTLLYRFGADGKLAHHVEVKLK